MVHPHDNGPYTGTLSPPVEVAQGVRGTFLPRASLTLEHIYRLCSVMDALHKTNLSPTHSGKISRYEGKLAP